MCKEERSARSWGQKCCTRLRQHTWQLLKQNFKVSAPFENPSGKNHSTPSASLGAGTLNHFSMFGSSTAASKAGAAVENCGRAPNHSVVSLFPQLAAVRVLTKQSSWQTTTRCSEQGICDYTAENTEKGPRSPGLAVSFSRKLPNLMTESLSLMESK